ncbi:MAG TPA: hypothetical protein VIH99_00600 [Bdellovibrionota bacterium]|jgi:hypothetical protein
MHLRLAVLPLILLLTSASAFAFPEALPGSVWLNGSRDMNGIEGYGTMGFVNQGVQWFSLPGEIPFTTYAAYSWRIREKNRTHYNTNGPSVGAEISKFSTQFGMEYAWQDYPNLPDYRKSFVTYLKTYQRFDFLKGDEPSLLGIPVLGFPTTFWTSVTYDYGKLEGVGSMGYLNQGIDWFRLPGKIVFRTLAAYHWRLRSLNRAFYNMHGPGLGAELELAPFTAGVEYAWLWYPELNRNTKDFRLYLTAYFDWGVQR